MNISLKHFLETGTLGKLHLGMSAEDVLDLLGPPDDGDLTVQNTPARIYMYGRYGAFTITFGDEDSQLEGVESIEWGRVWASNA